MQISNFENNMKSMIKNSIKDYTDFIKLNRKELTDDETQKILT